MEFIHLGPYLNRSVLMRKAKFLTLGGKIRVDIVPIAPCRLSLSEAHAGQ